jgi:hypothetical protein
MNDVMAIPRIGESVGSMPQDGGCDGAAFAARPLRYTGYRVRPQKAS